MEEARFRPEAVENHLPAPHYMNQPGKSNAHFGACWGKGMGTIRYKLRSNPTSYAQNGLAAPRCRLLHQGFPIISKVHTCHSERSEESLCPHAEILRCAQDDITGIVEGLWGSPGSFTESDEDSRWTEHISAYLGLTRIFPSVRSVDLAMASTVASSP